MRIDILARLPLDGLKKNKILALKLGATYWPSSSIVGVDSFALSLITQGKKSQIFRFTVEVVMTDH